MNPSSTLGVAGAAGASPPSSARLRGTGLANGMSPGKRAAERVKRRNADMAAALRAERDVVLSKHLAKGPQGDGSTLRVASREEQVMISEMLNRRMIELFVDPAQRNWYKVFVHMDDDNSGKINYEELVDMVRNELKVQLNQLPDSTLSAVWRALDEDNSGLITTGEFGRFMQLGHHVHDKKVPWKERNLTNKKAQGDSLRKEREVMRVEHRQRKDEEDAARRRNADNVYASLWGQPLSGAAATAQSKPLWRSPRALVHD